MSFYGNAIYGNQVLVALDRLFIPYAVSLDGSTIGAFLGFLGIVSSTIGGVYVATRNSRSEKASVALQTLNDARDKNVDERLANKDERIAYLEKDLVDCRLEKRLREEELEGDLDRARTEASNLREENARLREENHRLKYPKPNEQGGTA